MTEKEKMLHGMAYDTRDPELRRISNFAKDLMRTYNGIPAGDTKMREKVLLELFGACGDNVRVNQPVYVDYGCNISIGDNSLINLNCTLLDTGTITIGRNTLIGPDVKIYTATHPMEAAERFYVDEAGLTAIKTMTKPVVIGDNVWIGGGSIILPGITIGNGTIIGAGSVVVSDIPENVVACGVPCIVKRTVMEEK